MELTIPYPGCDVGKASGDRYRDCGLPRRKGQVEMNVIRVIVVGGGSHVTR